MIKLMMIGNLGGDALVKEINGKTVIKFNVAHTEKFKDSQGVQKEKTTWAQCDYWTDRTSLAPYLKKGNPLFVEGTPEVDTYVNKEGQTVATLRVRVIRVEFVGGGHREGSQSNGETSSNGATGQLVSSETPEGSDDLPF